MKYTIFMTILLALLAISLVAISITKSKLTCKLLAVISALLMVCGVCVSIGIRTTSPTTISDEVVQYTDRGTYALIANEDKSEHIAVSYDGMRFKSEDADELHVVKRRQALIGIYQETTEYEMH